MSAYAEYFKGLDQAEQARMIDILGRLAENNPKLIDQLEALAKMKEQKPLKFKLALNQLKS